ncbi:MAG TPA: type II secretion system protein [Verrucomicrobiae bacterium]|nr:type II secretion system protein [Verrucomicrobiae bacterium]
MRLQVPTVARTKRSRGFTLAEVSIALAIIVMVFASIILAYTQATYRAQWTGYSLAAESLAMRQIEQARSARWDPADPSGAVNQIYSLVLLNSNLTSRVLTGYTWTNLDLPSSGSNYIRATNFVTIKPMPPVAGSPNGTNIMVRVDTVWPFRWGTTKRLVTNTICTYVAPDNKDPGDLF